MDRTVNLQQLAYFREAVGAAGRSARPRRSLHLAQPSLSEQIRRLEGELGVPLFVRVGRGVVPTEAGRALLPHAERVLAEVDAAREAVRGVRDVRAGTASFGTFSTAVYYLLADLAEAFTGRYPGVRLRIVGLNSSAVADDVRAGRLEAGLVVLPVDAEGLVVQPALRDELLYVSSQPHRVRRPVSAKELARRPLILTDAQPRGRRSDAPPDQRARPGGRRHDRADRRGRVPQRGARARCARRRRRARPVRRDPQPPLPRRASTACASRIPSTTASRS